jgi:DNA-binding CsgD family transcriptional regulator
MIAPSLVGVRPRQRHLVERKFTATSRLKPADLRRALKFVRDHCAPDTVDRFVSRAVEGLYRLIPCDFANYGEVDPVRLTGSAFSYPPEYGTRELNDRGISLGFRELAPLFQNRIGQTIRLSEIISRTKFRRTDMFQEHFNKLGGRDLLAVAFSRSDGLGEFFSLFRGGYFSDRERALLDAVATPLQVGLTNARALGYLYDHRAMLESGLRNTGWNALIVDHQGRLLMETPEARRSLTFHFGANWAGDSLPTPLARWMKQSVGHFQQLVHPNPVEPTPFRVATAGRELVTRMILHPSGCLLLLREEDERSEWQPLTRLGLSRREAQVLNLVAMGKTNAEIGIVLGIAKRTVDKHVEHVFIQLRVETRTAAALAATEARSGSPLRPSSYISPETGGLPVGPLSAAMLPSPPVKKRSPTFSRSRAARDS